MKNTAYAVMILLLSSGIVVNAITPETNHLETEDQSTTDSENRMDEMFDLNVAGRERRKAVTDSSVDTNQSDAAPHNEPEQHNKLTLMDRLNNAGPILKQMRQEKRDGVKFGERFKRAAKNILENNQKDVKDFLNKNAPQLAAKIGYA